MLGFVVKRASGVRPHTADSHFSQQIGNLIAHHHAFAHIAVHAKRTFRSGHDVVEPTPVPVLSVPGGLVGELHVLHVIFLPGLAHEPDS